MKIKQLNPQILLESGCCLLFAALVGYLLSSKQYLSYVTPRMQPYLIFLIVVLLVWAITGLRRLWIPQYKIRTGHCFVLIIPILLFLIPHSSTGASALSASSAGAANQLFSAQQTASTSTQTTSSQPAASDWEANLPGLDEANRSISVSDDTFYQWLTKIMNHPEQYEGYRLSIKGFVFHDQATMKETEFVPARMLMSCCVADLSPTGIICEYPQTSELKKMPG